MPARGETTTRTQPAELQLLGWWELRLHGEPSALGRREERLISLLALHGRAPRPKVAGLLWPESSDEHAMTNLRAAVWRTRQATDGILESDRTTLWLRDDVAVDVDRLGQYAAAVAASPQDYSFADVAQALDCGDVLPGWYEDWVIFARERMQHVRFRAFEAMARSLLESGRTDDAARAARAALAIEPLHDGMNVVLVSSYLARGSTAEAVRHFRAYRHQLHRELGVTPSRRLLDLVEPFLLPRQRAPATRPARR